MKPISEILDEARAAVADGDGLSPIAPALVEVVGTLPEALAVAQSARRPVLTHVEGHSVCVYPAGTKPARVLR